ncbi:MAG: hypothetical protein ABGW78_04460, partial [Pirellulales bacterium]
MCRLFRKHNRPRLSFKKIGSSVEHLEPRLALSASDLISRSATLERTESVYFSDSMGPDPIEIRKSEIIGQSQPSFV